MEILNNPNWNDMLVMQRKMANKKDMLVLIVVDSLKNLMDFRKLRSTRMVLYYLPKRANTEHNRNVIKSHLTNF